MNSMSSSDSNPVQRELQMILHAPVNMKLTATMHDSKRKDGRVAGTVTIECMRVIVTKSCSCYCDVSQRADESIIALRLFLSLQANGESG